MLTVEKLISRPGTFRRLTGTDVGLFMEITEMLRPSWENRRDNFEKGGRTHSLYGLENHLLAMLMYYRCYVTYEFPSFFFDTHETTVMRSVKRIEKIAVQVVHIEKTREITAEEVEYLIIDATEQPVQRPKKGQKKHYSGKKKQHTVKTQYIIDQNGKIRSVSGTYPGKTHDFNI